MRVLAIGDIHGCLRALDTLLDMVQPRPEDLLITLGDYVDRGPDSAGVLDRLLELQQTGRLVALRGNHDQMMLDARRGGEEEADWLLCGGRKTLASYAARSGTGPLEEMWASETILFPFRGRAAWQEHVPERHWEFLEQVCRDWYETDTHLFVHANVFADVPLAEQPHFMLHWEPLDQQQSRPHVSGKVMICGHTSQRTGLPLNLGHAICIDTWVYGAGWLTCLDVATGQIWQANQLGETRADWIND